MDISKVIAVILAGGLGTRLKSVVVDKPKVLAPVCNRPFLSYILDQISSIGIKRAIISTGYLGNEIQKVFGKKYRSVELIYSCEEFPMGTAGAIRLALPLIDTEKIFITNGDSYCKNGFIELWDFQKKLNDFNIVMLLTYVSDVSRYGYIEMDKNNVIFQFKEKNGITRSGYINAGIYFFQTNLLSLIPSNKFVSFEKDIFPLWIGKGLLGCQKKLDFIDIGTPGSYLEAQRFFENYSTI